MVTFGEVCAGPPGNFLAGHVYQITNKKVIADNKAEKKYNKKA